MIRDARFYFANLTTDLARAARAAQEGNEARQQSALTLAFKTLRCLRGVGHTEAYEDSLLLMQGFRIATQERTLNEFSAYLAQLGNEYSPLVPTPSR